MNDCIFCKIISGEIKAKMVYQDNDVFAFEDIAPQSPVHILVIPKKHIENFDDLPSENIFTAISKIVQDKGLKEKGFRVVLNQGSNAGQAVPHIHFHVLSGRKFTWPPG